MRKVSRGLLGYAVMIAVFIFLIVILSNGVGGVSRRIEYPELLQKIENEEIDRVSIRGNSLVGRYKNSKISRSDIPAAPMILKPPSARIFTIPCARWRPRKRASPPIPSA